MDYGVDIYRAAEFCGANFDACLADPLLKDYVVTLRSAQGDFNLWCSAIKATSQGKASLDYRLRNHQDVRDTVCQLLAALAASLRRWATQAAAMHVDVESHLPLAVDMTKEMPDSPTSTDSPASWDAISDEWSNADSDRGEDTTVRDPIIGECMFYVKSILDQLARLSLAIRKAGNKVRFEKVDTQLDSDVYEPFRNHLASVILRAFPDPEAKTLSAEEKMKRVANYEALTPVQRQLVHANVLRRHRIEFVTRSRKKGKRPAIQDIGLVKYSRRLGDTQAPRTSSVPGTQVSRQTIDSTALQEAKLGSTSGVRNASAAPGSAPTATDIDSRIDVKRFLKAPTPSDITNVTKIGVSQSYPDCPKMGSDGLLICSYCDDVLPSSYAKGQQSWRSHVAQDLMPYSCFIDGCETPYEMYLTSESFLAHVIDKHSTNCWTCNFCGPVDYIDESALHHTALDFWSAEEWANHVMNAHSDRTRVAHLSVLADLSRRSVLGPLACPLCDFSTDGIGSRVDDHILQHLHEFALRALPEIHSITADDRSKASQLSGSLSHVKAVEYNDPQYPLEYNSVDQAQWLSNLEKFRSLHRCSSLDSVIDHVARYLEHPSLVFATTDFWGFQMLKVSNVLETILSEAESRSVAMTKDMIENIIEHTATDILNSMGSYGRNLNHDQFEVEMTRQFDVPGPPNPPLFTSQKVITDDIDYHLFHEASILHLDSRSQPKQQPRVLLVGSSGTAKTRIAGELARQTVEQRTDCSVFWVRATSLSSVSDAYSAILQLLNKSYDGEEPEQYLVYYLNWLLLGKWLMILEGIDGQTLQRMQLEGWLPSGIGGRLLLTSEDPSCLNMLGQVTEVRIPPHGQEKLPFQVTPALAPAKTEHFDVAIICQSVAEYDAIVALFDEIWEEDPRYFGQSNDIALGASMLDSGKYRAGQICGCNAVLALENDPSSDVVATQIRRSFKGLQLALLIGSCSGQPQDTSAQIFRGDVLIGNGAVTSWSTDTDGLLSKKTLPLNAYVRPLLDAIYEDSYGLKHVRQYTSFFLKILQAQSEGHPSHENGIYAYPGALEDKLFEPSYLHKHRDASGCPCNDNGMSSVEVCEDALQSSCNTLGCETQYLVARGRPKIEETQDSNNRSHNPSYHFGSVSCLDRVPHSMIEQQRTLSFHAVQDSALGLMIGGSNVLQSFPCMTVHGVRGYGDGHNSSQWTQYAAATAASAAKAILGVYNRMPSCMIPFKIDADESNHRKVLSEIRDHLHAGTFEGQKAMILGPRSSGKTQIAFQAVNLFRQWNPRCSVFWVSALSTKILDEGFEGVGRRLMARTLPGYDFRPDGDNTSLVLNALNHPDAGDWILIIDDISLYIPEVLVNWLQSDPHGSVLLVSRERSSPRWLRIPSGNVITVPPIEPRHTILHELAVDNRTYNELKVKWLGAESELHETLSMVSDKLGEKYSLKKRYLEELDVEDYTYEPLENRLKAIENVKRHYRSYMLPCEFVGYASCDQYFNPEEADQWINHIIDDHLGNRLPNKSACWYCDDVDFDASRDGDRMTHFRNRLNHIRIHIRDDGLGVDDIRPDYSFIAHLESLGLFHQPLFEGSHSWREGPVSGVTGVYAHDWVPPERQPQYGQSTTVVINERPRGRKSNKHSDGHKRRHREHGSKASK